MEIEKSDGTVERRDLKFPAFGSKKDDEEEEDCCCCGEGCEDGCEEEAEDEAGDGQIWSEGNK